MSLPLATVYLLSSASPEAMAEPAVEVEQAAPESEEAASPQVEAEQAPTRPVKS